MEPKTHEKAGTWHHPYEVKAPDGPLMGDGELPATNEKTISDSQERRILSSIVTECLDSHESCSGYYTDTSEQYVLRCHCLCHGKKARAANTSKDYENTHIDKQNETAVCTKERPDVVETNQPHPRPFGFHFRCRTDNLYQQHQHNSSRSHEKGLVCDYHIHGDVTSP